MAAASVSVAAESNTTSARIGDFMFTVWCPTSPAPPTPHAVYDCFGLSHCSIVIGDGRCPESGARLLVVIPARTLREVNQDVTSALHWKDKGIQFLLCHFLVCTEAVARRSLGDRYFTTSKDGVQSDIHSRDVDLLGKFFLRGYGFATFQAFIDNIVPFSATAKSGISKMLGCKGHVRSAFKKLAPITATMDHISLTATWLTLQRVKDLDTADLRAAAAAKHTGGAASRRPAVSYADAAMAASSKPAPPPAPESKLVTAGWRAPPTKLEMTVHVTKQWTRRHRGALAANVEDRFFLLGCPQE